MSDQTDSDRQRRVFVIHGRNEPARKAIFEFLRSIGLDPIEWSQAIAMTGKASPYIGEVLDAAFDAAEAIVVLETPDDIAYLHPSLTYPVSGSSSGTMVQPTRRPRAMRTRQPTSVRCAVSPPILTLGGRSTSWSTSRAYRRRRRYARFKMNSPLRSAGTSSSSSNRAVDTICPMSRPR